MRPRMRGRIEGTAREYEPGGFGIRRSLTPRRRTTAYRWHSRCGTLRAQQVPRQLRACATGDGSACALGEVEQGAAAGHPVLDIPNAKASFPITVEHSAQLHHLDNVPIEP